MIKVTDEDFNRLPLSKDINKSTLELLKIKSFKIKLNKGEKLFCEKDKVDKIYMILSGKVTMYRISEDGKKRVIYILSDGEFINEVIFDDLPASISCEAFEDTYILYFFKNDLLEIMSDDFDLTYIIINSMARKIRRLYRQLKNTVPIKMDKKLAAKLWKLSKDYGIKTEEGTIIDLNISITYLADMLGSTRETISRCVNNFEKKGMIKFHNKKILITDPNALSIYFRGI
ncbi:Crp/Fnr family transcriptional regulator [Clostridium sp. P21]|uniref:Crp/Fnr family transcriptional regulator n=1 Tax=Clostridium muellerianum TaxID=2716538 RepID=A0A7Y0ELP4_9CLOT|nr:Crp/Fnr family transcriptional regulator [Clostridium muellerianum]NMM65722.1 Crp/Fnr family transcriptional regulator [Clostridium muellerianum]